MFYSLGNGFNWEDGLLGNCFLYKHGSEVMPDKKLLHRSSPVMLKAFIMVQFHTISIAEFPYHVYKNSQPKHRQLCVYILPEEICCWLPGHFKHNDHYLHTTYFESVILSCIGLFNVLYMYASIVQPSITVK